MDRYGDFFPENPQTLDELLEVLAKRMAAMQSAARVDDARAAPADRRAGRAAARATWTCAGRSTSSAPQLRSAFPEMGWDRRYDFTGQDPLGLAEAASTLEDLGDLDRLEQLLRSASHPGALAEADIDRARELLGDESARSLEELARLTRMLQDAGLIDQREGRLELTPKGLRKIGRNALADLFQRLAKDKLGNHEQERSGVGHERDLRDQALRVRRPVQPPDREDGPQRVCRGPAAASRCACHPRTSRSSAPRTSSAARPC